MAVIAGGHTAFVYLERDGEVLLDKRTASVAEEEAGEVPPHTAPRLGFRHDGAAR